MDCALYVVATPIGNLKDITLRALEVLKNADIIAAEDTRNTKILLDKYSIKSKLLSYHKFCEREKVDLFLSYLKDNKSIALVSDAGTPLISDPGNILVEAAQKEGFRIIPIAGACALTALLSVSSRYSEDFKFIGFIERNKSQIQKTIQTNNNENLVFYDSPLRLLNTLEAICEIYPDKKITVGRELTKKFEEIKEGCAKEIFEYYKNNTLKGEIVVIAHKNEKKDGILLDEKIIKLKKSGFKDKEISIIISSLFDLNKNEVYKKCIKRF